MAEPEELPVFISPSEAFVAARAELDGADPETGNAPVYEDVIDVEINEPQTAPVKLTTWTASESVKLLSRVPCEVLAELLLHMLGREWWEHEDEVLLETLGKMGWILDAGGINKVRAMRTLLVSAPSSYHRYAQPWLFLSVCLSGRPVRIEDATVPSPFECALSILIAAELRPEPLGPEVLSAIAAACLDDHLWYLPEPLDVAQVALLRACRGNDIPVTQADVDRVASMLQKELAGDPLAIPDTARTPIEAQAIKALALHTAIQDNQARVHAQRDILREKLNKA